MKRKRLSIIRILFYMIILTVIGAVLFLGGRTYRSVKRVESYQIEITTAAKKLSYGKLREFDQGDNIDRIKRKRDRSHAELGKSAWRS